MMLNEIVQRCHVFSFNVTKRALLNFVVRENNFPTPAAAGGCLGRPMRLTRGKVSGSGGFTTFRYLFVTCAGREKWRFSAIFFGRFCD